MPLRRSAIAAAMLSLAVLAPPAHAVLPSGNVIVNGDAETGPGAVNDFDVATPPSWQTLPNFTQVAYGASGFPSAVESVRIAGGNNFFAGGPDSGFGDATIATQSIDLSGAAPEIDAGNVQGTLSAHLGGFSTQEDSAQVTAAFTDGQNPGTAGVALQPVTAGDRGGQTGFVQRSGCTTLPAGTRQVDVIILAQRTSGGGTYNDGYADNVSITLSRAACPTGGGSEQLPPPVEDPQPRVNANAQPTRGRVLVKQPGSDQFVELEDARSIPIGSEVDATKGAVQLETAANTSGASQTGEFYDGSFVVTQTAGSRPTTDLRVTGRIDKCPGTGKEDLRAAARRRGLWGNTRRGRYRTRGRYATATVRGTIWQTSDTCNTTTVSVRRGSVVVRDLAKRRNIKVKAGRRYTARSRKR